MYVTWEKSDLICRGSILLICNLWKREWRSLCALYVIIMFLGFEDSANESVPVYIPFGLGKLIQHYDLIEKLWN